MLSRGFRIRFRDVVRFSLEGRPGHRLAVRPASHLRPDNLSPDLKDLVLYSSQFSVHFAKLKKKQEEEAEKMRLLKENAISAKFSPDSRHSDDKFANVVPVALQYLHQNTDPVPEVQGARGQVLPDREIVVEGVEAPVVETKFFPYANYDPVEFLKPASSGLGRRGRRRQEALPSPDDAVPDKRDYEVITDADLDPEEATMKLEEDDLFKYGSANPEIPVSMVPCGGCGAHLHCQDTKMPGFIPAELFGSAQQLRYRVCQRCYVMKQYNVALKVSVSPDDYPKTISHLKDKKALILLVVDLVDFPGSVWPNLLELIGPDQHIFLIGNKVDLLPQDSKNYLKRIEASMRTNFLKKVRQSEVGVRPRLFGSLLVSARTGYNMEVLIDRLFTSWKTDRQMSGMDMYIVGTTNVGKSSIFNVLLDSDLCKHLALSKIEKAMTSPVPGTTLNLLKFPMSRPDPSRLSYRHLRLQREAKVFQKSEEWRIHQLKKTRDRAYALLTGIVGLTSSLRKDKRTVFMNSNFDIDPRKIRNEKDDDERIVRLNLDSTKMMGNRWCFDTPGTVSSDQIINLLTQEEIMMTLPSDLPILPRTYLLSVGQTLFIAGLGRFDLLKGPEGGDERMLVTVFTSDMLPINIVKTEMAEEFYSRALGSDLLMVPRGDLERLTEFPALEGVEMVVDGISRYESTSDVVFSSAGWITCSPNVSQIFEVKAWTPGGRGIFMREPPFLSEAVKLRGNIIKKTPAFTNDKVFIPQ